MRARALILAASVVLAACGGAAQYKRRVGYATFLGLWNQTTPAGIEPVDADVRHWGRPVGASGGVGSA